MIEHHEISPKAAIYLLGKNVIRLDEIGSMENIYFVDNDFKTSLYVKDTEFYDLFYYSHYSH